MSSLCAVCDSSEHYKFDCPKKKRSKTNKTKKQPVPRPEQEKPLERPKMAYKADNERSQLIGYADKFFSLYIRTRGSDGFDNYCYTCSVRLPIQDLQCGHFIPRRYLNTRWNELNCWPQCNTCNVEKHGNLKVYEKRLVMNYSQAAVDGLWELARANIKISAFEIEEVVDKYKGVVF